jgi:glycosyltransferase involved in cell wall biosynthesis
MTRIAILIPARNEGASLPRVVAELRRACPDADVLVVDDCSNDETPAILPGLGVRWLRLPLHLGIGGALRAGLRFAAMSGYDIVVRVDGDGQHDPSEVAPLIAPIRGGEADVVQGTRLGRSASWAKHVSRRLLASLLTVLTGRAVTDPTSGFWAFGPRAVRLLADHHPSGYPEPELLLLLHRNRVRVVERPVTMRPRLAGRTSLTACRLGPAIARLCVVALVTPLRPIIKSAV